MQIRILSNCQLAPGYNILQPGQIVNAPDAVAYCWIAAGRAEEYDELVREKAVKKTRRKEIRNA